ncbi:hypothetical protein scyTo_0016403, partial [Scyliorhinus torazame]|nr:hypothetical protein [Scyliorhinus torazame]
LADFGLSKIVDDQVTMKTVCGTPGYCAPEILRGCVYGPEVDMWSVGVITYILLCGFEPFYDERGDQYMYKKILNCDYDFVSPWWDEVSLNAKDLVKKLILLDPKQRLTTYQALQHPWVIGEAANIIHMDNAQKKLQEFNARRKLKAAVKAVVASSRLGSANSHTNIDPNDSSFQQNEAMGNGNNEDLGDRPQIADDVSADNGSADDTGGHTSTADVSISEASSVASIGETGEVNPSGFLFNENRAGKLSSLSDVLERSPEMFEDEVDAANIEKKVDDSDGAQKS